MEKNEKKIPELAREKKYEILRTVVFLSYTRIEMSKTKSHVPYFFFFQEKVKEFKYFLYQDHINFSKLMIVLFSCFLNFKKK